LEISNAPFTFEIFNLQFQIAGHGMVSRVSLPFSQRTFFVRLIVQHFTKTKERKYAHY